MLRRGISPIALFATMFVVFCGGPFAMEEIVALAGPGLFVLVLVVVPLVWAIPSALITAELVSAIPAQGGAYQWFRVAFGPFWAFQFTFLEWLAWALDAALYPGLIAAYLMGLMDDPSPWLRSAICLTVIWGCAWLNIKGVKEVGRLSLIITVVILVPVITMVLLAVPKMSFDVMLPFIPEDQSPWKALNYALIWAIWSYSGYSGLAAASEEIKAPERTYPKLLAIFVPISVVVYVMPVFAGVAGDPNWQAWGPAHLTVAAMALGGTFLAVAIATAGQVAFLGLYNGEQLILARYLFAMSRDGMLPPALAKLHSRYQTPTVALIFHAILFSALTLFFESFVELLVLGAIVSVPTYIFTFIAPLIIRAKHPNLRGPFRIPGGWPVLILTAFVPSCVALYLLFAADAKSLITACLFALMGPILYLAVRRYNLRHGIEITSSSSTSTSAE